MRLFALPPIVSLVLAAAPSLPAIAQSGNPPSGLISTIAGTGQQGYFGNGDSATIAHLWTPYGVALDTAGDLFIVETGSGVVREVATNGKVVFSAGVPSSPGYAGDGGAATQAQFNSPTAVALDAAGNLYIADTGNNVIRKIFPAQVPIPFFNFNDDGWETGLAPVVSTVAGNGVSGYSGDGSAATSAQLNQPSGVAVDAFGDLYIADTGNNVIRKVTPSGVITTIAGDNSAGYFGDGASAVSAQLNAPTGLALDGIGDLYIADTGNHVVRMVTPGGTISTVAGNGNPGFAGDGASALTAELHSPASVALDSFSNLYIADTGNQRVRMVTRAGIVYTVAGDGIPGYAGDGGPAATAELNMPFGVAALPGGNLYIADGANNVVREVFFGSRPTVSVPDFSLTPGSYTGVQYVTLSDATPGAVVHFTADGSTPTANSQIASFPIYLGGKATIEAIGVLPGSWNSPLASATYTIAVPVAPAPTFSPAPGSFNGPVAVTLTDVAPLAAIHYTLDGSAPLTSSPLYTGPITVSPSNSAIVIKAIATAPGYAKSPTAVAQYTVLPIAPLTPTPVISPNDTAQESFNPPYGDQLTVTDADPSALIFYTTDGSTPSQNSTQYNGPFFPLDQWNSYPWVVTISAIAISPGKQPSAINAQIYSGNPPTVSTIAGTGASGYTGDGGPALSATMSYPTGLVMDPQGNLYVADTGNDVIRKFTPGGSISTYAGGGTSRADGVPALTASLNSPHGLALDTAGNLYIADTGNNVIRKVTPSGNIYRVAGNGSGPIPVGKIPIGTYPNSPDIYGFGVMTIGGYSGDGVPATSTSLAQPWGVAVDAAGNIYIADTQNQRVRKVNAQGIISTVAGNGTDNLVDGYQGLWPSGFIGGGYTGDGGPAVSAELNNPQGVAVDPAGNLYISDSFNEVVRRVDVTGTITTIAGSGYAALGVGCDESCYEEPAGSSAPSGWLNDPTSLTVDGFGNVWVADTGDERVSTVVGPGINLSCFGDGYQTNNAAFLAGPAQLWYGTYTGDGLSGYCNLGSDRSAGFSLPSGIAVDPKGIIYIADSGNNVIREVIPGTP
jgi:sugar lactone lactonase YvrE